MLKYDHLVGLEFKHGRRDCFGLIRDFYRTNFDIKIPNYARPNDWWDADLNLYNKLFHENGFRSINVHPTEWRPGDAVFMAIRARNTNHVGVFVEGGKILHHLWGRRSAVEPYKGLMRNTTVAIVRSDAINYVPEQTTIDLMEIIPDAIRTQLVAHLPVGNDRASGGGAPGP